MSRSTEIKMILDNKGFEKGTQLLFAELYERMAALETTQGENNQILLQMATMMAQIVDGAGAMRDKIENMDGNVPDDAPNATDPLN